MRRLVAVIACAVLILIATSGRLAAQGGSVPRRVATRPARRWHGEHQHRGDRGARHTNEKGEYEIRVCRPARTRCVPGCLGYVPQIVRVTVSEAPARPPGLRAAHTADRARAGGRRGRLPRAARGVGRAGCAGGRVHVRANAAARDDGDESGAPGARPVGEFPASERQPTPATSSGLHAARTLPDQTLVLVNGWRQHQTALVKQLHLWNGRRLERRRPEHHSPKRVRPDRGAARRRFSPNTAPMPSREW